MCDRVGVMQAGELVECGPAGTVLDTPRHPYTRRLLAAVPDLARTAAAGRQSLKQEEQRREEQRREEQRRE